MQTSPHLKIENYKSQEIQNSLSDAWTGKGILENALEKRTQIENNVLNYQTLYAPFVSEKGGIKEALDHFYLTTDKKIDKLIEKYNDMSLLSKMSYIVKNIWSDEHETEIKETTKNLDEAENELVYEVQKIIQEQKLCNDLYRIQKVYVSLGDRGGLGALDFQALRETFEDIKYMQKEHGIVSDTLVRDILNPDRDLYNPLWQIYLFSGETEETIVEELLLNEQKKYSTSRDDFLALVDRNSDKEGAFSRKKLKNQKGNLSYEKEGEEVDFRRVGHLMSFLYADKNLNEALQKILDRSAFGRYENITSVRLEYEKNDTEKEEEDFDFIDPDARG